MNTTGGRVRTALDADGLAVRLAVGAVLLVLALALQWANGAYTAGTMVGADDPAHFVSGLMVRDYLAQGAGASPVAFATTYYAHYPKVAIGNWPPVYYAIQGVWMLVAPARPESVLLLVAGMAAATAWVTWRMLRSEVGSGFAAVGAACVLLMRPVQVAGSVVMAEIPLALFCTLAAWCWIRFMRRARARDIAWFALWAAVAVLTKPNGLLLTLVPPVAIVLGGRWDLLRARALWVSVGLAALASAAWLWRYLPTMRAGWQSADSMFAELDRLDFYPLALLRGAGPLAVALAAVGAWVVLRRTRGGAMDGATWGTAAAVVVATVLFHALAPAGLEARHLVPAYPFVAMFLTVGLYAVAAVAARAARGRRTAAAAVVVATAMSVMLVRGPAAVPRVDGFAVAAAVMTGGARSSAPVSALVLSSAEGEGALVVEMTIRDHARPRHTVWRASKLLSQSTWAGRDYAVRAESPDAAIRLLDDAAVDWVVMDDRTADVAHQQLLSGAIVAHPERFRLRRRIPLRSTAESERDSISVLRFLRPDGGSGRPLLRQVPGYEGIAVADGPSAIER